MIDIIEGDITTLAVDAVVNAANSGLRRGGGVDGAIHRAAGPELADELALIGGCPTGNAVRTGGHRLPARYVIHAVGPVWQGGHHGERELLASAYESAFARAREVEGVRSIAFPAISTGIYGFPKPDACRIAIASMLTHEADFERIVACLFDEESAALYREILAALRQPR